MYENLTGWVSKLQNMLLFTMHTSLVLGAGMHKRDPRRRTQHNDHVRSNKAGNMNTYQMKKAAFVGQPLIKDFLNSTLLNSG
jgi:hypothetical protein